LVSHPATIGGATKQPSQKPCMNNNARESSTLFSSSVGQMLKDQQVCLNRIDEGIDLHKQVLAHINTVIHRLDEHQHTREKFARALSHHHGPHGHDSHLDHRHHLAHGDEHGSNGHGKDDDRPSHRVVGEAIGSTHTPENGGTEREKSQQGNHHGDSHSQNDAPSAPPAVRARASHFNGPPMRSSVMQPSLGRGLKVRTSFMPGGVAVHHEMDEQPDEEKNDQAQKGKAQKHPHLPGMMLPGLTETDTCDQDSEGGKSNQLKPCLKQRDANSVHCTFARAGTSQTWLSVKPQQNNGQDYIRSMLTGHKAKKVRVGTVHRADLTTKLGFMAAMVKSSTFDLASGGLIVASTVCIGVETDYMARHSGESNDTFGAIRNFFAVVFLIELLVRVVASRTEFLTDPKDRGWNLFDTFMVVSSLVEFVCQFLDEGNTASTGRVLRIMRIVRITRAMRLGRILRYARTFRQIVYSLQSSMGTLLWAMVMIFLVLYCFAICFVQAATDEIVLRNERGIPPTKLLLDLRRNYQSVPSGLYSLYMAMTGGQSWGELCEPLGLIHGAYLLLFLGFISLTYFGVLNVVTAIFVDSAMQSQQHYKELLIQESVLRKELYSQHLREVFREIDQDNSGCINGDEMEFFLADPALNLYLESIDIFPNDARSLFRLLDHDDSGEVSIDEFCEGCLRLKGEAKSFDIHCLLYNNERHQIQLTDIISKLEALALLE